MSRPAWSIFIFGLYLVLLGCLLAFAPDLVMSLSGLPPASDPWVRLAGMLLLVMAFYYISAARNETSAFFYWTLYTRGAAVFFLAFMVLKHLFPPVVLLFWLGDLAGAAWTMLALRRAGEVK